jgi:branched-chain amino acid transport system substrate-binding protein
VDTPLGKIKFDDRGDAIGVGFSVYQVKDGKYVELKN